MGNKTLNVENVDDLKAKVNDVEVFGNGNLFKLICKASSKSQGWMKSTKAMGTGRDVVVQVTTQQRNPDGTYAIAEALTLVPNAEVRYDDEGNFKIEARGIYAS